MNGAAIKPGSSCAISSMGTAKRVSFSAARNIRVMREISSPMVETVKVTSTSQPQPDLIRTATVPGPSITGICLRQGAEATYLPDGRSTGRYSGQCFRKARCVQKNRASSRWQRVEDRCRKATNPFSSQTRPFRLGCHFALSRNRPLLRRDTAVGSDRLDRPPLATTEMSSRQNLRRRRRASCLGSTRTIH